VHWPDPLIPVEETAAVLRDLLEEGKIRAIGVSNFNKGSSAMPSRKAARGALAAGFAALSMPLFGPMAAAASPGATDFSSYCAGCHAIRPGANGIGPSLAGIYGRTSGTVPGYSYSPALKSAKLVWNEETLNKFLQNPSGLVSGTKMFVSVPDAATRQRIIAYLKTLKP
jgi:cytochrome c2